MIVGSSEKTNVSLIYYFNLYAQYDKLLFGDKIFGICFLLKVEMQLLIINQKGCDFFERSNGPLR